MAKLEKPEAKVYRNFEWDQRKASANLRKHGVSFDEAKTVFLDPLAQVFDDSQHSRSERRELAIGHSNANRLLFVAFAERSGKVRIIRRLGSSAETMKKAAKRSVEVDEDDLLPEYRLDYSKARPNRFAQDVKPGGAMVVLEPDVAEVFRSSESVNQILRSLIAAVRKGEQDVPAKKRKAS